ncbi:nuclear transport factor 2 family protein [Chloroflexota bacterium]
MKPDPEIHEFLLRHLNTILENDVETYHATTSEELTLYEWWVTPHRLDGLPFHDFMMAESARRATVFGAEEDKIKDNPAVEDIQRRLDLANLHIQRYGDTAIASYTLLFSAGTDGGVSVSAHNESRVLVKLEGRWQVVHCHKSPAWPAPHVQPVFID